MSKGASEIIKILVEAIFGSAGGALLGFIGLFYGAIIGGDLEIKFRFLGLYDYQALGAFCFIAGVVVGGAIATYFTGHLLKKQDSFLETLTASILMATIILTIIYFVGTTLLTKLAALIPLAAVGGFNFGQRKYRQDKIV